ncbi:MAG TPA: glycosyltransferase family 4 protein [Candidatus Limnocylindria bacterium]|nr:glycosyltransferase family 4 protein [Candidatus Limnocylindria bacterium]
MRIAQVAPLFESVPPHQYGGTERVVSWLTEELVRQGHEVTLVASGDSETSAELLPAWPTALRLGEPLTDTLAPQLYQIELMQQEAHRFDVIHWHTGYLHLPMARRIRVPQVTTMHGRIDLPELRPLFGEIRDAPLISISDDQRRPIPDANWVATIHHGLPEDLYAPGSGDGGYLAFLGRISPEKRVDRAVEIARRTGMPLKVAAKVDPVDEEYFETEIRHLFDDPLVEYIGEIGEDDKGRFLGDAAAMLFPIDWPEPFGIVMIEAMALGTPTIAMRTGSVPEVLEDGVTGSLVTSVDEAVAAVQAIDRFDRAAVRRRFEERFTAERMAAEHVTLFEWLIQNSRVPFGVVAPATPSPLA